MAENSRTLKVAAIQSVSRTGDATGNLARAARLVAEAAAQGAELALCPEFLTPGYIYDRVIWRDAEPRGGRTESWLAQHAAQHALYIGAGYLEVDGEDFFNTFALAGPDGAILGRVRKQSLPGFEGWVFRSSDEPKSFETPVGRVAVGICNDNHTRRFFERMLDEQPDLLLMPHSAPHPIKHVEPMRSSVAEIGPFYAQSFGVPTLVVNKAAIAGGFKTPMPGYIRTKQRMQFPGMSTITDSNGRLCAQLGDGEDIVCAAVTLEPARKRNPSPPKHFYWSKPPHQFANSSAALFVALERLAKRAYAKARLERLNAIEALLQHAQPSSSAAPHAAQTLDAHAHD